jgi:hypothetical protein
VLKTTNEWDMFEGSSTKNTGTLLILRGLLLDMADMAVLHFKKNNQNH